MTAPLILSPETAIRRLLESLRKPATLLVAASGGSDSTGLLVALSRLRDEGTTIRAVTVDHRLRLESGAEAIAVGALCARLGISHEIRSWDADKPISGISAAAREARYRLLCEAADACGASAIVSGHTFDDQVETVTMRAERSADPDAPGLAGMAGAVLLQRRHWLLRPLLHSRRQAIRDFLTGHGHGWIDDPSNSDTHYERVRTRARLAEQEGVPVARIAAAAQRRWELAQETATWLADHAHLRHGVLMHIAPDGLRAGANVLGHVLSVCAAVLGGRLRGPGGDSMQRVVDTLGGRQPARLTAGRVVFDLRRDGLYLCREHRGLPLQRVLAGETQVGDGRFRVANRTAHAVDVGPSALERQEALHAFPGVPSGIAMRAARVMPHVDGLGTDKMAVKVEPLLAPFDRFLPQFDLPLARVLAAFFECGDFPAPPFENCERKS